MRQAFSIAKASAALLAVFSVQVNREISSAFDRFYLLLFLMRRAVHSGNWILICNTGYVLQNKVKL